MDNWGCEEDLINCNFMPITLLHYQKKTNLMNITFDDVNFDILEIKTKEENPNFYYFYDKDQKYWIDTFILADKSIVQKRVKITLIKNELDNKIIPRFDFIIWNKATKKQEKLSTLEYSLKAKVNLGGTGSKNLWKLIGFLSTIPDIQINGFNNYSFFKSDEEIVKLIQSKDKEQQKNVLKSIIENFTTEEINNVLGRKKDLEEFKEHLINLDWGESDWDDFFKKQQWIFGLGLNYRFLVTERTQPNIGGHEVISGKGDRKPDTLVSTDGDINFTILIEIKKPDTNIFNSDYRGEKVPLFSEEFYGGINQILSDTKFWELEGSQTKANLNMLEKNDIYTISPKGILIIGRIQEFENDMNKRNMFQNFRQNYTNIEIITYDELFKRAYYIVHQTKMPGDYFIKNNTLT
jgi:Domain of unknown function (DUF4263)